MKWLGPLGGGPASGTLGSMVATRNRGGQVLRQLAIPVNPNTPRQQATRGAMGIANDIWRNSLTPTQRTDWDTYAELTPLTDSLGKPRNVGGKAMLSRAMVGRFSVGFGPLNFLAPPTPGVALVPALSVDGDTTIGIEVSAGVIGFVVGSMIFIRLSPAVNQTKNQFSSPYTFATAITSVTSLPVQIRLDTEVFVGQRYFVSARQYTFDNRVSVFSQKSVDILV